MTKWEYTALVVVRRLRRKDSNVPTLKELGESGWELVSVDQEIGYFKRAIPVTVNVGDPTVTTISKALREQGVSLK